MLQFEFMILFAITYGSELWGMNSNIDQVNVFQAKMPQKVASVTIRNGIKSKVIRRRTSMMNTDGMGS